MNLHDKTIKRPEVTTGPLTGSRKIYSVPEGHADLAVPFREVALSEGAPASSSEAVGQTRRRSDWQVHPTMSLPVRSRERDDKILTRPGWRHPAN